MQNNLMRVTYTVAMGYKGSAEAQHKGGERNLQVVFIQNFMLNSLSSRSLPDHMHAPFSMW